MRFDKRTCCGVSGFPFKLLARGAQATLVWWMSAPQAPRALISHFHAKKEEDYHQA